MEQFIYILTMIKLKPLKNGKEDEFTIDSVAMGIHHDFSILEEGLLNNSGDMFEASYTYACIEKVALGVNAGYRVPLEITWYKATWANDGSGEPVSIDKIDTPEFAENIYGFWC